MTDKQLLGEMRTTIAWLLERAGVLEGLADKYAGRANVELIKSLRNEKARLHGRATLLDAMFPEQP